METPVKGYYRFFVGNEVRLRHAYYVTCTDFVKDENGKVVEIHGTYDDKTKGGWSDDGRKVRGTIHWVSARHSKNVDVVLYDRLFKEKNPDEFDNYKDALNENSKIVINNCKLENSLEILNTGDKFQFLRNGFFCVDKDSQANKIIFNRVVTLKDSFKIK